MQQSGKSALSPNLSVNTIPNRKKIHYGGG